MAWLIIPFVGLRGEALKSWGRCWKLTCCCCWTAWAKRMAYCCCCCCNWCCNWWACNSRLFCAELAAAADNIAAAMFTNSCWQSTSRKVGSREACCCCCWIIWKSKATVSPKRSKSHQPPKASNKKDRPNQGATSHYRYISNNKNRDTHLRYGWWSR